MTPYSDKFWSPLVWVMTCYQFSANPLHVGLGQLNSKIGIAAQFKFQNWKWNSNWWIENGIGNTCIGIGIENYVNGIEILQLLLYHFIVNQPHSKKERRSLSFMWPTSCNRCIWLLRHGAFPPVVWSQKSLTRCLFPLEWTEGLKMVTLNISLNLHDTFKLIRLIALHSVCIICGLIIEAKWCKSIFVSEVDHDHQWFRKWHVAYSAPKY